MEFSRARILEWVVFPFPSPGDLPNPGIEPWYPTLQADSLPAEPQGKPPPPTPTAKKKNKQLDGHFKLDFTESAAELLFTKSQERTWTHETSRITTVYY